MYQTIIFKAANDNEAQKEVSKLLKPAGIETWQIVNFSPVHDKEHEYDPDIEQYKVIVLLTADQVQALEEKPAGKKK